MREMGFASPQSARSGGGGGFGPLALPPVTTTGRGRMASTPERAGRDRGGTPAEKVHTPCPAALHFPSLLPASSPEPDAKDGGAASRGSSASTRVDPADPSPPLAAELLPSGLEDTPDAAGAALRPAEPPPHPVRMLYRAKTYVRDCPPPLSPMAGRLMFPYQPTDYQGDGGSSALPKSPLQPGHVALEPHTPASISASAPSSSVPASPARSQYIPDDVLSATVGSLASPGTAMATPGMPSRRARVGRQAPGDGSGAGGAPPWLQNSLVEFWGLPPDRCVVCVPDAMVGDFFEGGAEDAAPCTATDLVGAARAVVPPLHVFAAAEARRHDAAQAAAATASPPFALALPPRAALKAKSRKALAQPRASGASSAAPASRPGAESRGAEAAPSNDARPTVHECARLVAHAVRASRYHGLPRHYAPSDLIAYALRVACASLVSGLARGAGTAAARRPSAPVRDKQLKHRAVVPAPLNQVGGAPGQDEFAGAVEWARHPLLAPLRAAAAARVEERARRVWEAAWASVHADMYTLHTSIVEERSQGGGTARGRSVALEVLLAEEQYLRRALAEVENEHYREVVLPVAALQAVPLRCAHRHRHDVHLRSLFPHGFLRDYLAAVGLVRLPYPDRMVVLWARSLHTMPAVVAYVNAHRAASGEPAAPPAAPMTEADAAALMRHTPGRRRPAWAGDLLKAAEDGDVSVMDLMAFLGVPIHLLPVTLGGSRKGPLHIACAHGHARCLRSLAGMGVDINAETEAGAAAVHIAAKGGRVECVQVLLELGVGVDARDSARGWTPLHYAMHHGQVAVADALIAAGAPRTVVDHWGRTPYDTADTTIAQPIPTAGTPGGLYPAPPTRTTFWAEDTCKAWGASGATPSLLASVPQAMGTVAALSIEREQRLLAAGGKRGKKGAGKGQAPKKKK
eukprot:TRINITY_DN11404_c0_g1_i1.p1 TRINITY_DN11404_c0_g1~~TRINITY_DN11404_c0_g1_i1.p1  ORF type:complete len:916 (+),score=260.43 TRINITY_DN11404_c0_g1_i1:82-2829(+)